VSSKNPKQFEIYQVNLNPVKGSEQKGLRPCLILQTNAVSDVGRTTVIAPITSKKMDKIYPYEVGVDTSKDNGLKSNSKIKLDQIRVIDKSRIGKKLGALEPDYHNSVFGAIDILLDRLGDFRQYEKGR
jgi:mRNA interferase MazF